MYEHNPKREGKRGGQPKPFIERFWSKIKITNTCWIWTGARHDYGYGLTNFFQYQLYTHKVSWQLTYGEIPKGKLVCHKCDNPPCVRPTHLFIGSPKDNIQDMIKKGRNRIGEKVVQAKLSPNQVRRIRKLHGPGMGYIRLSHKFGVSASQIHHIIKRISWKHI